MDKIWRINLRLGQFGALADPEAFACRTRTPGSQSVEFAGPYPITPREYKVLDGFRKDPTKAPAKF